MTLFNEKRETDVACSDIIYSNLILYDFCSLCHLQFPITILSLKFSVPSKSHAFACCTLPYNHHTMSLFNFINKIYQSSATFFDRSKIIFLPFHLYRPLIEILHKNYKSPSESKLLSSKYSKVSILNI